MILEALGSAVIGLGIALALLARYPARFRQRPLTLATGPAGAVLGAVIAHTVLGAGNAFVVLPIAAGFAAAMLSLLVSHGTRTPTARLTGRPVR